MSSSAGVGGTDSSAMECEPEYDEVLVYVDFPHFDELTLLSDISVVDITGLCGETPKCKIGDLKFVGEHEVNLGTQLFVDNESGKCIGTSINVLNFKLRSIDTADNTAREQSNE